MKAQNDARHFDTLLLQNRKIILQRAQVNFDAVQTTKVKMPSEYLKGNKKLELTYNPSRHDYSYSYDEQGNEYQVTTGPRHKMDTNRIVLSLTNVADTIDLVKLLDVPQIRSTSTGKKYYLCHARVYKIQADTITAYDFSDNELRLQINFQKLRSNPENAVYILTDIYYRKQLATYFLDKSFILNVNYR